MDMLPYMALTDEDGPRVTMDFRDDGSEKIAYAVTPTGARQLAHDLRSRGCAHYLQSSVCNHSEEYGIPSELMTQFEEWIAMAETTPLRWLIAWRQSHHLTQAEAAALFGVHHVTYARWELGTRTMDGAALRLAQVLQTPQGVRLVQRLNKTQEP